MIPGIPYGSGNTARTDSWFCIWCMFPQASLYRIALFEHKARSKPKPREESFWRQRYYSSCLCLLIILHFFYPFVSFFFFYFSINPDYNFLQVHLYSLPWKFCYCGLLTFSFAHSIPFLWILSSTERVFWIGWISHFLNFAGLCFFYFFCQYIECWF